MAQDAGEMKKIGDPFDLECDPYLARGPTGTFHCKKCLTTHPSEANYVIHRNGRRHKAAIDRTKKYQDLAAAQRKIGLSRPATLDGESESVKKDPLPIPSYSLHKEFDSSVSLWSIKITVSYPKSTSMPGFRLLSAHEQNVVEVKDSKHMFLVIGCKSFRTVAFRIPSTHVISYENIYTQWKDNNYEIFFLYCENSQNLRIATIGMR